jgi:NAD(P)-dependent dehydrogenase (short-subunit alcohol dehydrogenase family)
MSKIILVTGASSGIGKETALELAKQGNRVLIHGRDAKKTAAVMRDIQTKVPNAQLEVYVADLSLMKNVVQLATEIRKRHTTLDVLINNAGGQFGRRREVTAEGHEKTFATNVLAPFLLTQLLLPSLRESSDGRVVTVSSESYRQGGKPYLDDIELQDHYSLIRGYGLSKLYVWWLMRYFAAHDLTVTFNTCEPGSTMTNLGRVNAKQSPVLAAVVSLLWRPMMQSIDEAAATSVFLATSPSVKGQTGGFYGKSKMKRINAKWLSAEGERIIWDYANEVCRPYFQGEE